MWALRFPGGPCWFYSNRLFIRQSWKTHLKTLESYSRIAWSRRKCMTTSRQQHILDYIASWSCNSTQFPPLKVQYCCINVVSSHVFHAQTFFFPNSSNRSAGEHLDVRLLLILPSPFILLFHPSPRCHSSLLLWAVKRMKGSVSLPRRERGGEVKRQRKRLERREQDHPACPYHFHLTARFHIFIPCFLRCSILCEYSCGVFAQNLWGTLFLLPSPPVIADSPRSLEWCTLAYFHLFYGLHLSSTCNLY